MENRELIERAIKYIDTSKGSLSDLTADTVAKEAGFSTDYFNRIFRSHTGFNVIEYARFRRISRAAVKLRQTDKNVIDIGLEAGYDSHDGFTRAFRAQYGMTPSEYRAAMKDTPVIFADLNLNATAAARIIHALPEFREIPRGDVIDYLLSANAPKFGYDAVSYHINGTCLLADTDYETTGCFIGADMFYPDGAYLYLHVRRVSEIRGYIDKLKRLDLRYISITIEEDTDEAEVRTAVEGIGHTGFRTFPWAMYFGDKLNEPPVPFDGSVRFLCESDTEAAVQWADKACTGWKNGLRQTVGTPRESHPDDQPLGLFIGGELIAVARPSLQSTHGFTLNNCITIAALSEYRTDEMYRFMYIHTLNEMLSQGCIPFDDQQFGEYAAKNGNFTALDIGFTKVNEIYMLEF
nr:helix-turn-helix transcriptional regulator [Clostridia bacterium]